MRRRSFSSSILFALCVGLQAVQYNIFVSVLTAFVLRSLWAIVLAEVRKAVFRPIRGNPLESRHR